MEQLILVAHLLIAVAITGLIMLQQGKGAEMGASFGAGASQTLFGSSGSASALTKATAVLAAAFFATSFALAIVAKERAEALTDADIPVIPGAEAPAAPAPSHGEAAPPEGDVPVAEDAPVDAPGGDEIPVAP